MSQEVGKIKLADEKSQNKSRLSHINEHGLYHDVGVHWYIPAVECCGQSHVVDKLFSVFCKTYIWEAQD